MPFRAARAVLRSSTSLSAIRNKYMFPNLRMDPSVRHDVNGVLSYGTGCSIGSGSILSIPRSTTLHLGDEVYVGRDVQLASQAGVEIGDFTSIQDRCLLVGDVTIGRYCTFSLNVLITSGRHHYGLRPHWLIKDQDAYVLASGDLAEAHSRPVTIEDDCWLGVNSVVLPGVTIGKGCVVGANAVATKDLPPYVVVAGSPARIIKNRLQFSPPRSIEADAELDLPYFYAGFGVSKRERESALPLQGLVCDREFSVALDASGASEVALLARTTLGKPCKVRLGDQLRELNPEYRAISFTVSSTSSWRFDFKVEGSEQRWPLCVKKAWVE